MVTHPANNKFNRGETKWAHSNKGRVAKRTFKKTNDRDLKALAKSLGARR
jgi:hypothetical protein